MPDFLSNMSEADAKEFLDDLGVLVSLELGVLSRLASELRNNEGVSSKHLSAEGRRQLHEQFGMTSDQLASVSGVLAFLFSASRRDGASPESVMEVLGQWARERAVVGLDERAAVIQKALTPTNSYLRRQAIKPYAVGVNRLGDTFASQIDIRVAYASKDSDVVAGFAPIATVKIGAGFGADGKEDRQVLIFSLSAMGLRSMIEHLAVLQRQMDAAVKAAAPKLDNFDTFRSVDRVED